jgi:hypothetical protein
MTASLMVYLLIRVSRPARISLADGFGPILEGETGVGETGGGEVP